jgi:pilus assembly protein Flp/PilA
MNGPIARFCARFGADETGATAIEYAILASLIAGVIIAGAMAVGSSLTGVFNNIANKLEAI